VGEVERVRGSYGASFDNFRQRVQSTADAPKRQQPQDSQSDPNLKEDQVELHEDSTSTEAEPPPFHSPQQDHQGLDISA
jgi:hypothetical protein